MKTAFIIYTRAVGLYGLVTLPIIISPLIYIFSLFYVAIYGWFAWGMFSMFYLLGNRWRMNYAPRMLLLAFATVISVAFAYQVMEMVGVEEDIWHSGFIWFPVAAVVAGWVSLFSLHEKIKADCPGTTKLVDETPEWENDKNSPL